ncbi:MAG: hypothetical protein Kow00124_05120 [Anaerolineae bacterium]
MTSNNSPGWSAISPALGKGCLLGVGLAGLFFGLSALLYLLLGLADLPSNIRLLIAIAGGPILGTVIAFVVLSIRASRETRRLIDAQGEPHRDDETASRH